MMGFIGIEINQVIYFVTIGNKEQTIKRKTKYNESMSKDNNTNAAATLT